MAHLRLKRAQDPLISAIGCNVGDTILDCTMGMGHDALVLSAAGCVTASLASSMTALAYGIVLISVGAGTMYTPTLSLARGLWKEEGLAATASGLMFGSKVRFSRTRVKTWSKE